MNLQEWALFFGVVIVLFVIAPKLINYMFDDKVSDVPKKRKPSKGSVDQASNQANQVVRSTPIVYKRDCATGDVYDPEARSAETIGRPRKAGKADKQIEPEQSMISKYYTNALENVPRQYCQKPIGACPVSKAMSSALPVGNIPMCMAKSSPTMMLSTAV